MFVIVVAFAVAAAVIDRVGKGSGVGVGFGISVGLGAVIVRLPGYAVALSLMAAIQEDLGLSRSSNIAVAG